MSNKKELLPIDSHTTLGKNWVWIFICFFIGLFFYQTSDILPPFLVGFVVAYCLSPIVDLLSRYFVSRTLASFFIIVIFFAAIFSLILFAVPFVQEQVVRLAREIPEISQTFQLKAQGLLEDYQHVISEEDMSRLRSWASDYMGTAVKWVAEILGGLFSSGLVLANILSFMVITPLVSFYLLCDWPRLVQSVYDLFPRMHRDTLMTLMHDMGQALSGFARGQALVCFILMIYYGIGLELCGLPSGWFIGCLTGFLIFIPYLGFFTGFIIAMLVSLFYLDSTTARLFVLGVFMIGQALEGSFLTPYLVGSRIGLHPVWVIFAVFAGGALMGLSGIILAMPVAAVLGVLVRFLVVQYRRSPLYQTGQ